ncbi:MAG: Sapep family Mn(2+)-dependent dipeptidase [Lachnospiraceae bacterium]|nr:Sapep family Mn(2+)-dependent dipeptidase [Lachnospiraceae bacterium]
MYREKIDAYIDSKKDEMIEDLKTLVRIDSQRGRAKEGKPFGDGPAKVVAAAEGLMKQYGLQTTNYDNYVVTGDFGTQEKALDILAHLDVVPVTEDWTVTEPFQPKVVDGRIYGRGTADDKGPAIAALYALRAIRELGLPMKKSVRLILGSDEECGSGDLEYYYAKEQEAPYTFTPDADFPLINIEKGSFKGEFSADFPAEDAKAYVVSFTSGDKVNVVPARATLVVAGVEAAVVEEAAARVTVQTNVAFITESQADGTVKVSAKGVAAHASTPAEGKNALTATLRLITALPLDATKGLTALLGLEALFPYEDTCGKQAGIDRENEESGALTLCFSIMDYTPEHLHAIFDARLPIGCTKENTSYPVKEALAQYGITLDNDELREPHCVPGDSWFVQTLLGSYERYFGKKGKALSTGGGTYVHELERGVAFGCMVPEVDNHMHGDDEFMEIEMLLRSAKIFADAILKICNAE